jgi:hypothetical protein
MTPAEASAHGRLKRLYDELEGTLGKESRGIQNLRTVPLSADLLADIKTCIASDDHIPITFGLFILQGVMLGKKFTELPKAFYTYLLKRIEGLLEHPVGPVVYKAMGWLAQHNYAFPDYRQRMLAFLAADDLGRRETALRYYESYCKLGEIEPLLRFEKDDYASESRMMGPYEYVLRDRALGLIEKQLKTTFPKLRLSEPHQGTRVSWYDWRPFHQWWNKSSKRAKAKGV